MAIIRCHECGKDVSDKAAACPHCGNPMAAAQYTVPSGPRYNRTSDCFEGTLKQIIALAVRAVQERGWQITSVNDSAGLINFETKMSMGSWTGISCSMVLEEAGYNRYRVKGTAKQNVRGFQMYALNIGGEAEGKLQKAIETMKELAGR